MDKKKSKITGKYFGKALVNELNANKEGLHSMNENVSLWRNSLNKTIQPDKNTSDLVYNAIQ